MAHYRLVLIMTLLVATGSQGKSCGDLERCQVVTSELSAYMCEGSGGYDNLFFVFSLSNPDNVTTAVQLESETSVADAAACQEQAESTAAPDRRLFSFLDDGTCSIYRILFDFEDCRPCNPITNSPLMKIYSENAGPEVAMYEAYGCDNAFFTGAYDPVTTESASECFDLFEAQDEEVGLWHWKEGTCSMYDTPNHLCSESCAVDYSDMFYGRLQDVQIQPAVVVAGGYADSQLTASVEVMGQLELPPLPHAINSATLTAVGTILHLCGGSNSDTCYSLDTVSKDKNWRQSVTLPKAMNFHTASVIGSNIWLAYYDEIYDFDTITNEIVTYQIESFQFSNGHCAVSTDSKRFMIGVGSDYKEVWVNSKEDSLTEWTLLGVLNEKRQGCKCLLFDGQIFITGGFFDDTGVEILDLASSTISTTGNLVLGRAYHGMIVLDGQPAVVAGWLNSNSYASIETYNPSTQTWTISDRTLEAPRDEFAIAQIV